MPMYTSVILNTDADIAGPVTHSRTAMHASSPSSFFVLSISLSPFLYGLLINARPFGPISGFTHRTVFPAESDVDFPGNP